MLDNNIKAQLGALLPKLEHTVEIRISLDEKHAKSAELKQFVDEISSLSDKITVVELPENEMLTVKPIFGIARPQEAARVWFGAIPMGHEFTTFVLALLQVGGYPPKISQEQIENIRAIDGKFNFVSFVSLSCHVCPEVMQSLNLLAVLNPNIQHTMIDGGLFPKLVEEKQIMAVPTVFLNDAEFDQGRITLEEIVNRLDQNASQRDVEKINKYDPFDVLVIGGGPAGSAAAIYAARKGLRTGIVAERMGGQILDTLAIENFISVTKTEGPQLAAALAEHIKFYGIEMINLQQVEHIENNAVKALKLKSGAQLKAKSIILSTGAHWRELGVPGEQEFRGKGVAYCPHCDGPLFKGKDVIVVGGGNSGIEAAIDLAGIVRHVTVIEFLDQLRADGVLLKKLESLTNVKVIKSAQVTEIIGQNHVERVTYKDRISGEEHQIDVAAIFVQIGLLPNTKFLSSTVELNSRGEIVIDERCQTSAEGIFAAGDCTTVPYKQIIISMGEGSKAALSAFDYLVRSSVK